MMENNFSEELLDKIRKSRQEDKVAYAALDGLYIVDATEFISQCADGILYDLNRDETTTVTLAKGADSTIGRRWINDLAVAFVIRKLKEELDKYKKLYE